MKKVRLIRRALQVVAWLSVAALFLILQPVSEWLAGGWDPGVNMNQGVYLGNHGFDRTPLPVFESMAKLDKSIFVNDIFGRDEAFPGVPINNDGAFSFYFYSVTPLWIAFLYWLGGMFAVFRAMSILGLMSATLFFYGLRSFGWSKLKAGCAAFMLLLQPIVIYHMHTPCSEMMELMLVTALMVVIAKQKAVWLFPLIILACLNRPGFIMPAGILVLLLSFVDQDRISRRALLQAMIYVAAGLACSLLYYHTVGSGSVVKISRAFTLLELGSICCLVSAFIIYFIRYRKVREGQRLSQWLTFAGVALPVLIFLISVIVNPRGVNDSLSVVAHLVEYTGWPLSLLAAVGLVAWLIRIVKARRLSLFDLFIILCMAAFALPAGYKHAADLYPWATKRFLSSLPILVALCSVDILWRVAKRGIKWRVLAIVTLVVVIGWNAKSIMYAWNRVEYRGLHKTISKLADKIEKDDLVVSDHFLWATPLALSFDRQALNGERLWADSSLEQRSATYDFLRSWHSSGHRILLLTSTEAATDIFPSEFRSDRAICSPINYSYQIISHHKNSKSFSIKQKHAEFLLLEWIPNDEQ